MKKLIEILILILVPIILALTFWATALIFGVSLSDWAGILLCAIFFVLHIFAMYLIIFKNSLKNSWLMIIGFSLVLLLAFIADTLSQEIMFKYLGTILVLKFYTVPFSIITVIFMLIKKFKSKSKKEDSNLV